MKKNKDGHILVVSSRQNLIDNMHQSAMTAAPIYDNRPENKAGEFVKTESARMWDRICVLVLSPLN